MEWSAQVQRVSEKYLRVKGVVCQVNGGGVVRCCGCERVKGVCQVDGMGVVIVHLSGVVEMGEVI
jgi:hypothetical protein